MPGAQIFPFMLCGHRRIGGRGVCLAGAAIAWAAVAVVAAAIASSAPVSLNLGSAVAAGE